jgi:DNA-directed RNA polymerase specialized sigma subunit
MEKAAVYTDDIVERRLPTKAAFGGLLDKPSRFLEKPQQLRLKQLLVRISAEYGKKLNDVLDHYGVNRHTYYYHIDPLDAGEPEPAEEEERALKGVLDLLPSQQLEILAKIDRLTLDGQDLCIACANEKITLRQYYSIDRRKTELERRAAAATNVAMKSPAKERVVIDDPEERKVAIDAAALLALSTKQRAATAARAMGLAHDELSVWSAEHGVAPLFDRDLKKSLPLGKEELKLAAPERIRFHRALTYLEQSVKANRTEIAGVLGFKQSDVDAWAKVCRELDKIAREKEGEAALWPADMERVGAKTSLGAAQLGPWLKAYGMRDVHAQVELPNWIQKKSDMEPRGLIALWQRVWDGTADRGDFEALTVYYRPIAEAIARQKSRTLPKRIPLETLEGYALPHVLLAIKRWKHESGGQFANYACAYAEKGIIQGNKEDLTSSKDLHNARKRLRDAEREWRMTHEGEMPIEDLADLLETTEQEAREVLFMARSAFPLSIDAAPSDDDDRTISSKLADPRSDHGMDDEESGPGVDRLELLFSVLDEKERMFMRSVYVENGSVVAAGMGLGLCEADAWSMHSSLLWRCKQYLLLRNGDGDELSAMATKLAGKGRVPDAVEPRTDSIETLVATAPELFQRVVRWLGYAQRDAEAADILTDLSTPAYARSFLRIRGIELPDNVDLGTFIKAASLVLRSKVEAA